MTKLYVKLNRTLHYIYISTNTKIPQLPMLKVYLDIGSCIFRGGGYHKPWSLLCPVHDDLELANDAFLHRSPRTLQLGQNQPRNTLVNEDYQ